MSVHTPITELLTTVGQKRNWPSTSIRTLQDTFQEKVWHVQRIKRPPERQRNFLDDDVLFPHHPAKSIDTVPSLFSMFPLYQFIFNIQSLLVFWDWIRDEGIIPLPALLEIRNFVETELSHDGELGWEIVGMGDGEPLIVGASRLSTDRGTPPSNRAVR